VLLTTAAMPSVAPIHNRMPFIIRDDQLDLWLNNSALRPVLHSAYRDGGTPHSALLRCE
jgi:putative SOS response-associated peptidase YedK